MTITEAAAHTAMTVFLFFLPDDPAGGGAVGGATGTVGGCAGAITGGGPNEPPTGYPGFPGGGTGAG
ncbi:hypothetical protein [Streptomyces sp. NBC_01565]|uniref:hypothetical protein n=1 Tax=unclassified Streptomyces TaxID=2593676 RepID=UPI002B1CCD3E|nr:hypothetical protein [Streptomyces sp. NBC_01565]